jgi:hypothetical protein
MTRTVSRRRIGLPVDALMPAVRAVPGAPSQLVDGALDKQLDD